MCYITTITINASIAGDVTRLMEKRKDFGYFARLMEKMRPGHLPAVRIRSFEDCPRGCCGQLSATEADEVCRGNLTNGSALVLADWEGVCAESGSGRLACGSILHVALLSASAQHVEPSPGNMSRRMPPQRPFARGICCVPSCLSSWMDRFFILNSAAAVTVKSQGSCVQRGQSTVHGLNKRVDRPNSALVAGLGPPWHTCT